MTEHEHIIAEQKQEIFLLKAEIAQLKRMLFGAKRERFISADSPLQGNLFANPDTAATAPAEAPVVEVKAHQKKKSRKGVSRNEFPAHLERINIPVEPQGVDVDSLVKIGEDVTELLSYIPGKLNVKRIVRPRYADKGNEDRGVLQAPIPPRLIPKGMVDESLVAHLIVEKTLFHTPVHRFNQKLKQEGVHFVGENNLNNWLHRAAEALTPVYHLLKADLLAQPYVQADESHFKVLSNDKPGASHKGYMWVLNSPKLKAVYFQYDKSRSNEAGKAVLEQYNGTLQTDGYPVYASIQNQLTYRLIHCMAHARREFIEAKDADPPRANAFLSKVALLYDIERIARTQNMTDDERLALRQEKAVPILEEMGIWLQTQMDSGQLLPSGLLTHAIAYALKRWNGLCAYAHDPQLEIDNNLIENAIRPIALGRKNYLFAGSHEAAQNLAVLYSIVGTAKLHGLNVQKYLEWLLRQVAENKGIRPSNPILLAEKKGTTFESNWMI
jgi:transposase